MSTSNELTFTTEVLTQFPALRERTTAAGGALHIAVGDFALFTQAAKDRGDWPTYERCIQLADRLFTTADATLGAAFRSSFFAHLHFDGTGGPAAWQLLTPPLQAAWKEVDAVNRRLMALPQTGRKDSGYVGGAPRGGKPGGPRKPKGPKGPQGPKGPTGRRGPRGRGQR